MNMTALTPIQMNGEHDSVECYLIAVMLLSLRGPVCNTKLHKKYFLSDHKRYFKMITAHEKKYIYKSRIELH